MGSEAKAPVIPSVGTMWG